MTLSPLLDALPNFFFDLRYDALDAIKTNVEVYKF